MENLKIVTSCFLLLLLFACSPDEVDTEAPNLDFLSFSHPLKMGEVCGNQEELITIIGGDTFVVEVAITDNENLSQYKIDIHNNFDCHGHDGNVGINLPTPNTSSETSDWTILDIEPISGKNYDLTLTLFAPENVTTGLYHFQLQAIDESGNDVPFSNFYNLKLVNEIDTVKPEIQLIQPVQNSLTVNRGDNIQFSGTLSDNYSLFEGGNGVLFLSYRDENSGNTFLSNQVFQITEETTSYNFDFNFTVPNSLTSGNYTLFLSGFDGVRNGAEAKKISITVN